MREALRNPAVRRILAAAAVSQVGDWAARLAIAFVVLDRTGLAAGVGVAGALFFLPWLGPGQLLAGMGDRLDRVRLLTLCEVSRAVLFGVIALSASTVPVWLLLGSVAVVALIDPVWEANRAALIVDVTTSEEYSPALKMVMSTGQAATLVGWAVGGFLVAGVGTGGALGLNAASFALSAILIGGVRSPGNSVRSRRTGSFSAARAFLAADRLSAIAVVTTVGFTVAAMAVEVQAPVYGRAIGLADRWIGVMIALVPAVTMVGVLLVPTGLADRRLLRWGFAVAGGAGLASAAAFASSHVVGMAFVAYAMLGAVFASSTLANIVVGRRLPVTNRAAIFAVVQGSVFVALSAGSILGGPVSDLVGAETTNVLFTLGAAACCLGGSIATFGSRGSTEDDHAMSNPTQSIEGVETVS